MKLLTFIFGGFSLTMVLMGTITFILQANRQNEGIAVWFFMLAAFLFCSLTYVTSHFNNKNLEGGSNAELSIWMNKASRVGFIAITTLGLMFYQITSGTIISTFLSVLIVFVLIIIGAFLVAVFSFEKLQPSESIVIAPENIQSGNAMISPEKQQSDNVPVLAIMLVIVSISVLVNSLDGYRELISAAFITLVPLGFGFFMLIAKLSWIIKSKLKKDSTLS